MSVAFFGGDTMVPIIEYDSILLLGYSILYKEDNLNGFNTKKRYSSKPRWIGHLLNMFAAYFLTRTVQLSAS